MRIDGVGDGAVEVEVDACGFSVGGHQGDVFLHFFFRVVVFRLFVPDSDMLDDSVWVM